MEEEACKPGELTDFSMFSRSLLPALKEEKGRGRDYFTFEDGHLGVYFTEQANDPSSDNTCWKKHLDEKVSINPRYMKTGR